MKTRMQPIGNAWQKLPRVVRDLSSELGKQIELVMSRRRDRARPAGPRGHQGPAHPHGPQLGRSRHRVDRRAHGRGQARRAARSASPPTTRAARSRSRSPTTARASTSRRSAGRPWSAGSSAQAEVERMTDAQVAKFIFHAGLLDRGGGHLGLGPRRRHGRGQDQHRDSSAASSTSTPQLGPRHHLHHQDPADAGDRRRPDRARPASSASRCRRWRCSNWCGSTSRRRRGSSASTARRCCACASGCCRS